MAVRIRPFKVDLKYEYAENATEKDFLDTVLQAEKYISNHERRGEEGSTWQSPENENHNYSFYSGDAGIAYFYIKLYKALKNEEFRQKAEKGIEYLTSNIDKILDAEPALPIPGAKEGLYFGIGGVGLALIEAYEALGDEKALDGAIKIAKNYITIAKEDENGVYWTISTAAAMDGGVILYLLKLSQVYKDEQLDQIIRKAGKHFLSEGARHEDGTLEYNGFKNIGDFSLPNFEFGSSGAGYILAKLYEYTGEDIYLEASKSAAAFIKALSVKKGNGILIPYRTGLDEEPIFYLSSCHGPAGTAKLFYKLYKITGEKEYYEDVQKLVEGIKFAGAPRKQSVGFWNNVSLCCGNAGLLQLFVGLYNATAEKDYLDLATETAKVLVGEKEDEGEIAYWPIAFTRVLPDEISTNLGYYDGAAGIASALLQYYLTITKQFEWHRLIDDAF